MYRRSRTFFTANGGLFVFAAFQPATRQARMGVTGNIREHTLEIFTDTHRRIGRRPEKPQIFLYLVVVVYPRIKEHTLQVTPTAKRNSYRVAILVGRLPRVADFVRNPGLWKRNSYRVAAACGVYPRSPSLAPQGERIEPISQTFTMGCEFILLVFEEIGLRSFPLRKTGVGLHFTISVTMSAGSYLMIRELVTYVTCSRALCYEGSCLMIRSWRCGLLAPRLPFRAPQCHLLRRNHPPVAYQFHPNMQKHGVGWRFNR